MLLWEINYVIPRTKEMRIEHTDRHGHGHRHYNRKQYPTRNKLPPPPQKKKKRTPTYQIAKLESYALHILDHIDVIPIVQKKLKKKTN